MVIQSIDLEEIYLKQKEKLDEVTSLSLAVSQSNVAMLYQYGSTVHAATVSHVAAVGGSKPKQSLGGSLPQPNYPPGLPDGPSPNINQPPQETNQYGTGYLDQLKTFLSELYNNPGNPKVLMNFMQFIKNLDSQGLMTSKVMQLLDTSQVSDAISKAFAEMELCAFFYGYKGETGGKAAGDFLTDTINALSGTNPYIQQMLATVRGLVVGLSGPGGFIQQHTAQEDNGSIKKGDLIWVSDDTGAIYDFSNPDDKQIINTLINYSGFMGAPDSWPNEININELLKEYRVAALDDVIASTKNPILIFLLFITIMDGQFQGQQGGLANTTQIDTHLTNKYATPLTNLANLFGNLSGKSGYDNAQKFKNLFYEAEDEISSTDQARSFAGQWKSSVFDFIKDLSVTIKVDGKDVQASLGDIMSGATTKDGHKFDGNDLVNALNSFGANPPSPSGDPSPVPTTGQGIINAITQGGGLITGASKAINTQLSVVADTDNEVIKLGQSAVGPTGGGLVQMDQKFIDNQKT